MSPHDGIAIRAATSKDARQVLDIYAPFCTDSAVSFEVEAPALDEMRRRIDRTLARFPWLVAERERQVLGFAYASEHRERAAYRWAVDATVYVKAGDRRAGVGRRLYTELFAILSRQGYINVFAGIALPNPASVGLHESLGFVLIGVYRAVGYKLGGWHDVGWWQLVLRAAPARPDEPVPFAQIGGPRSP
jgi:phosphinothricin acetyltransferase